MVLNGFTLLVFCLCIFPFTSFLFFALYYILQNPLGTDNIPSANITRNPPLTSISNSNSKSLKCTLRTMVIIITIGTANMQRDARRLRETLQSVRDHLGAQIADLLALESEVDDCPGSA
jgi:type III secretory pathway component EscR